MPRIIAGSAKATKLDTPSRGTRPTTERVRESLMSSLHARGLLEGAIVMDCFAGTGAIGLEAVSRGAQKLYLIDKSPKAFKTCQKNAERVQALCVDAEVSVHKANIVTFLRSAQVALDLVFLDPPYDYSHKRLQEVFLLLLPWIHEDTVLILEGDRAAGDPPVGDMLKVIDRKQYGQTVLWWLQAADLR